MCGEGRLRYYRHIYHARHDALTSIHMSCEFLEFPGFQLDLLGENSVSSDATRIWTVMDNS